MTSDLGAGHAPGEATVPAELNGGAMTAEVPTAFDPEPLVHRATGLLRRLGLGEGERVVTLLDNSPETLALGLACQLARVVQVPLYPDLPPREVAEIVADAAPHAVIASPQVPPAARPEGVRLHVLATGGLDDERALPPASSWPRTRPMTYTSGTTGRRKGVHVGVRAEEWGREVVLDEYETFGERHGERHLVVCPLHHSAPFRFAFVTAFLGGRVAVLPRVDAQLWRETLRAVRPTSLFCVPTQLHRLLSLPSTSRDDLASLALLAHAGSPCPVRLKQRVLDLAPDGSVWEFYGSTEGQFTVCPPDVWREAPGTVGQARPGRRLEIRDDDRSLPPGQVGTVWAHVPERATWRYWRDPLRTAEAWDDEAFTVGDLGHLDAEGRLTLEGRQGDLVISGGVNVYPAEVERRLLEHPAVAEAVAFSVPDEEWGERLVAAVIPRPQLAPSPDDLRHHCREGLQRAKVPKRILVVEGLPRTPTGKVRRTGLAEALGLAPT